MAFTWALSTYTPFNLRSHLFPQPRSGDLKKMRIAKVTTILALFLCAGVASASIITYSGDDAGVGPGGAKPNSDAAHATFAGATSIAGTITFEGLPLGFSSSLSLGGGNSLSLTGDWDTGNGGIRNGAVTATGYNTTSGGSEYLGMWPSFVNGSISATFNFGSSIDSFGAYLTGTEDDFPGTITLNFSDGSSETLAIPKNPSGSGGGVQFFGFTDAGASISSVTFTEAGDFTGGRDIWGIDDVSFGNSSVPEPGSILLFGTGLAILAGMIRRKLVK